jgi:hypothetical protein
MWRTLAILIPPLAALGCNANQEFLNAAPETSALQLELTGGAADGVATSSTGEVGASAQALGGGPVPEFLQHTRDGIAALNEAIADLLQPIEQAVAVTAATEATGDTRTWGFQRGDATFRFIMKRLAPKSFGWLLVGKPNGAADSAYVAVMAGAIQLGDLPHRGRGILGIDLDQLAAIDDTFHGSGQLLVGFAHVAGFKVLAYGLHQFSSDVTRFDPVDAIFSGWRGPLGDAHVRLALYSNLADTATPAKELLLLHARWLPLVGGRVDAVVTAGDVPAGHVLLASSCFNADLDDGGPHGFLAVRDCAAGVCTVIETAGAPANCAPDFGDEQLPPKDPMDPTLEPGAPAQPTLPSQMPSGN